MAERKIIIALSSVIVALGITLFVVIEKHDTPDNSRKERLTRKRMLVLQSAANRFAQDVGHPPASLDLLHQCGPAQDSECLPWNPKLRHGWNGPYLLRVPGEKLDGWGGGIDLQEQSGATRLVSAGPDRVFSETVPTKPCAASGDDIVLCVAI